MNNPERLKLSERLLARTGGAYIPIALGLVTLVSYPVGLMAAVAIYFNAEMEPAQLTQAAVFTTVMLTLANAILVGFLTVRSRDARQRLRQWKEGDPLSVGDIQELRGWQQINRMPTTVGQMGIFSSIFLIVLPLMLFEAVALGLTRDQLIYTFFGAGVSSLAIISLFIMLVDQMMQPARKVLLPESFQNQLAGSRGLPLLIKSLFIILSLISIAILLIAPIGYHQTIRVLYSEVGSIQVLGDLQVQSISVSIAVLTLGLLLGWLLIRAITNPTRNLIEVFSKVEQGDLKQRASVQASDELGELAVYFNRMITRLDELQSGLERQVEERTAQLEAVNEVGRVASSILDPDELVNRVVNLIADRFGYYYAAIFLLSPDGRWAELRHATGEAGTVLLSRRHRLEIGGRSMVSAAVETGRARIALDVGQEAVRFNNPLLPGTRSEIALPLMVGDRILGALDVQSTLGSAFSDADIRTLQGMANQVAIAVENARLFQETQTSLEEIRAIQRQYLSDAWTRKAEIDAGLEFVSEQPSDADRAKTEYELPLALRDQIIGEIKLESEAELSPDERGWIEAIATQTALALENARLFEESQDMATRERLTAEITRKIWSSTTVAGILQTTIRELGRALNVTEATIQIGPEKK